MEQHVPVLGQLLPASEHRRDAVHVAIAPVTAAVELIPGERIGLVEGTELVGHTAEPIGIVDPYLLQAVKKGERFWMFLFPNTVTTLRHVWTHPAFTRANNQAMEKVNGSTT